MSFKSSKEKSITDRVDLVKSKTNLLSKKISKLFNFIIKAHPEPLSQTNKLYNKELAKIFSLSTNSKKLSDYSIFSYLYVGLLAKVASIDGVTKTEEIQCFYNIISAFSKVTDNLRDIFFTASNDPIQTEHYALKIHRLFPRNDLLYQQVLYSLINMAESDGYINNKEIDLLKSMAKIFGYGSTEFSVLFNQYFTITYSDPYEFLGLAANNSNEEIQSAYKIFARKYHPDNYSQYSDISNEYIKIMESKFNQLNEAYRQLKK